MVPCGVDTDPNAGLDSGPQSTRTEEMTSDSENKISHFITLSFSLHKRYNAISKQLCCD